MHLCSQYNSIICIIYPYIYFSVGYNLLSLTNIKILHTSNKPEQRNIQESVAYTNKYNLNDKIEIIKVVQNSYLANITDFVVISLCFVHSNFVALKIYIQN